MTDSEAAPSPDGPSPDAPSREDLKRALKAFRKRLKVTRLDDESRLGYGPMTGGGKSGVVAVRPPDQYPPAVWEELVRQGRLKYAGHGLYELVEP